MPAVPASLVGNIVATPELKHSETGKPFTRFRVAVNERFRDNKGDWKDHEPIFWNVEAWNEAAEIICAQFTKGAPVIVTGTFRSQSWQTETGEPRSRTYVKVDAIGSNTLMASRRKVDPAPAVPPADVVASGSPTPAAAHTSVEQLHPEPPATQQPGLDDTETWAAQA